MGYVTRDQTQALERAAQLVLRAYDSGDRTLKIRTYVTDEPADGLGRSTVYYVDQLPLGEEKKLIRVYDMVVKPQAGWPSTRCVVEEVPV